MAAGDSSCMGVPDLATTTFGAGSGGCQPLLSGQMELTIAVSLLRCYFIPNSAVISESRSDASLRDSTGQHGPSPSLGEDHCRSSVRNCLAHSVNQRTARIMSQTHNLKMAMSQSDTVCTKAKLTSPCPHMASNQAGRADMMRR
jgi:hypothetical protein